MAVIFFYYVCLSVLLDESILKIFIPCRNTKCSVLCVVFMIAFKVAVLAYIINGITAT